MGNRQDDRNARIGTRNVGPGPGGGRASEPGGPRGGRGREAPPPPSRHREPGPAFHRNEDMGGSQWSGASGRGGYGDGGGYPAPRADHSTGREYARAGGVGYANEGRHEDHDAGGFLSEDTPGHVPNQRWSGGYGGDREAYGYGPSGPPSGRGFTGNDFGGLPPRRDRAFGAPADLGPRHFGNEVDLGGRTAPGGSMPGYGFRGTDMGMGAPDRDEDRGPHYGKGPKGYKRSDERTREDVCDAIAHQGYIDASDVEVKVEDGAVTLSGTVAHRQDKRRLEHLVEQCRGVHDVHNELRLKRAETSQVKPQGQEQVTRPADLTDGAAGGHKNGKTARSS